MWKDAWSLEEGGWSAGFRPGDTRSLDELVTSCCSACTQPFFFPQDRETGKGGGSHTPVCVRDAWGVSEI